MNRRSFAACLAVASTLGVSGCTFGQEEHRSVTIENRDGVVHETALEVTSSFGGAPGDTDYFDETTTIESGDVQEYDEAISVSDGPPQHVWMRLRIDGAQVVDREYRFPEETIRVRIAGSGDVSIDVDS